MKHSTGSVMALCILLTGCATTGLVSDAGPAKKFVKATPQNPAVKSLCVWQTAEGYDAQGKPCRGVAGQIFFFNSNSPIPVMVEGDVRVYLFDDQGSETEQSKPVNQFDIDRQSWNGQLTSTQFGPAYRLFVPYTRPGRNHAELALRLRMSPENGPVVFSTLSTINLDGHKLQKSEESPTTAKVEQVLKDQLSGAEQVESRVDNRLAEASLKSPEQSSSRTIATIRTAAQ